jgi:hypothetical protein
MNNSKILTINHVMFVAETMIFKGYYNVNFVNMLTVTLTVIRDLIAIDPQLNHGIVIVVNS